MGIISSKSNTRKAGEKATVLPYLSLIIRDERIKLGLKQTEFAKQIGIGLKTLRKIEQGNLNVNYNILNYLLNCLGLYLRPSELVVSPVNRKNEILSKEYILQVLENIYPILEKKYGVDELALFGSYVSEQANQESDIDILINFRNDVKLEIEGEIQLILENLFKGIKVDLTLKNNLHKAFKSEIEETKINVSKKI